MEMRTSEQAIHALPVEHTSAPLRLCIGSQRVQLVPHGSIFFPSYWNGFLRSEGVPDLQLDLFTGQPLPGSSVPPDDRFELDITENGVSPLECRVFFGEPYCRLELAAGTEVQMEIRYSRSELCWTLKTAQPALVLTPPLDQLLFLMIITAAGGVMMHASGVQKENYGLLFTGRSGTGKSTLARMFTGIGCGLTGEDRIGLRRRGKRTEMFSIPGFDATKATRTLATILLFPVHAAENRLIRCSPAEAVVRAGTGMVNHPLFPDQVRNQLATIIRLLDGLPSCQLLFRLGKETPGELIRLIAKELPGSPLDELIARDRE